MKKKSASDPKEPSSTVTSIRLSPSELREFEAVCAQLGVKRNTAIRSFMRKSAGYLEPDKEVIGRVANIQRQITGAANNLNQLAKVANRTGQIDVAALGEDKTDFLKMLLQTNSLLQEFLNVAKRRSDGRKLMSQVIQDG